MDKQITVTVSTEMLKYACEVMADIAITTADTEMAQHTLGLLGVLDRNYVKSAVTLIRDDLMAIADKVTWQ